MDKGTDHVGHLHVCTSASLEQVLPSRNCHQEILLGSVVPCHCLLRLLWWVSSGQVCHLQMSCFLMWVRMYCLPHKSISGTLHGGNWEMGMLLGWQVQKINFLVWKHGMVMVLDVEEWEHSNFYSHFHIQYLLMWLPIWRNHPMWSWSNWIIFLLQCITGAGYSHYWRKLCTPSQWHCCMSEGLDLLSKTVELHLMHSIWNIHEQMASNQ